uniref:Phosvitin n=1 Tax=Cyclopterus lumpus TaxID=8103 RepID=A0A8C3AMF4_CYCLU
MYICRQSLTFLDIQKAPLDPVKGEYLHRGSVQYEFGSELLQTPIQLLKITNIKAQVVELLEHMVTHNVDVVHKHAPLKFIELLQLLRVAKCDILETLWTQYKNRVHFRRWILNIVPAIGTTTALRFLKEKFLSGELSLAESSKTLLASLHKLTVDLEAIKLVEASQHKFPILREIVMLGYGTLVAKYCVENPSCPAELVRPLHELAVQAENAGHPSSLKPITKLLPLSGSATAVLPLRVQIEAVMALRNIAKREPKMIQTMAIQLFMDKTLNPELRMVAALVLFETKLPMGLVITLANASSSSSSSSSSSHRNSKQTKYLSDTVAPAVTILIRALRVDRKVQGYQIAAYVNTTDARVQVIFANLEENDNWRICADGVILSDHKAMAKIAWGIECKEYDTEITAETGLVSKDPAIRLKLTWDRLPKSMMRIAKEISKYISRITKSLGVSLSKAKNIPRQIQLSVAAASDTTLNIVLKTPKVQFYCPLFTHRKCLHNTLSYRLHIHSSFSVCSMVKDKLTTFNNNELRVEVPQSCFQVLAQDCTEQLKFIVMLKRDEVKKQNQIHLYPQNNAIIVRLNSLVIPYRNLPYLHPQGKISIQKLGDGIALFAPCYGLQEVYIDLKTLRVSVVDWMRGKICGLCGKADGEIRQEFQTPNTRLVDNAVSFAHSWVLPGTSCRDASECYMRLESVKLERQVIVYGQKSKCFSVEPVLRCLPGCVPVRTTAVNVGYHCLPADSNLNRRQLSSIFEKSIDLRETADAHLACRCTPQCA